MITITQIESRSPTNDKLSIWRKIGYGVGQIYGGCTATILSFYYLFF